jgi:hypothetical protein
MSVMHGSCKVFDVYFIDARWLDRSIKAFCMSVVNMNNYIISSYIMSPQG